MNIKIEFGASPGMIGDRNDEEGFVIWKLTTGGPTAGVLNVAWTSSQENAEMVVDALNRIAPILERSIQWVCRDCKHQNPYGTKLCNYCGTKSGEGN